jgi:hypothetical protein
MTKLLLSGKLLQRTIDPLCRIRCWPFHHVSFVYGRKMCKCTPIRRSDSNNVYSLYYFFLFTPFYLFLLPFFISSSSCAYKPAATVCTLYKRVYKLLLFGQIEFPRPFSRSTNGQCWCNLLENLDGRTGHTSLAAQGDEILNSIDGTFLFLYWLLIGNIWW